MECIHAVIWKSTYAMKFGDLLYAVGAQSQCFIRSLLREEVEVLCQRGWRPASCIPVLIATVSRVTCF